MSKKNKFNFILKIKENGVEVQRYETSYKRRFYNKVRTINWRKDHPKVYLRVSYGKFLSNKGKYENFWNDGVYDNEEDFMLALNAFVE